MLTYYVLSQDCWIWVASDLSLTFFFAIENRISRFQSGSFPRAVKTTLSPDYDVVNREKQTLRTRGKRKRRKVEAIVCLGRLTMWAARAILIQRVYRCIISLKMKLFVRDGWSSSRDIVMKLSLQTPLFFVRFTLRTAALNTGPSLYLEKSDTQFTTSSRPKNSFPVSVIYRDHF